MLSAWTAEAIGEDGPGVAVGIVRDGEILSTFTAGRANLEFDLPITGTTRFNIASNGKQFTALCILKLAAEGKLDPEADFRDYLPGYFPDIRQPIRIRHLLTHRSGIRDVYDLWSLQGLTWWQEFLTNTDALDLLKDQRTLNFEPGSAFAYSNSNYLLLAAVVAEVAGIPFADYAAGLFTELGMFHTAWQDDYLDVIPERARPYGQWRGWKEYPSVSGLHGDGGLFTSLDDQLQWERLLQREDRPAWIRQSEELPEGSPAYGYGWEAGTFRGKAYRFHEGSTGAYNASFVRFPDASLAVVVLANNGAVSPFELSRRIAAEILGLQEAGEDYPIGPDNPGLPVSPESITGLYRMDSETLIRIAHRGDSLYREIEGRPAVALIPGKTNVYTYASNPDLKMAFDVPDAGEPRATIYFPGQAPINGTRVPGPPEDLPYRRGLEGTFRDAESGVSFILAFQEGDRFTWAREGTRERDSVLYMKDGLQAGNYALYPVRDSSGNVTAYRLEFGRSERLIFSRY